MVSFRYSALLPAMMMVACTSRHATVDDCKEEVSINLAVLKGDCSKATDVASCEERKNSMTFWVLYEMLEGCEKSVSHAPYPFRYIENMSATIPDGVVPSEGE